MDHPFSTLATERRSIAALVLKKSREQCTGDECAIAAQLEQCVASAVQAFADARVSTYVSLFALQDVQACIQAGSCDASDQHYLTRRRLA